MVMMWSLRLRFTKSTIAHRVVDLPLPVGPVTSTSPLVRKQSFKISLDSPMSSAVRILLGICRKTAPIPLRSRKTLQRKRASVPSSYAKSVSFRRVNSSRFFSGINWKRMRSTSFATMGPSKPGSGLHLSVFAHHRRNVGGEMNIGSVVIELYAEKLFNLQSLGTVARGWCRRGGAMRRNFVELRFDPRGFAHDLDVEILPADRLLELQPRA